MTDFDALVESIKNQLFEKEPLAMAIMGYLDQANPQAHKQILDNFDKVIDAHIQKHIEDYKHSDEEDLL